MQYKSIAQRRKLKRLAKDGKIEKEVIVEMNIASRGLKLPTRLHKKKKK